MIPSIITTINTIELIGSFIARHLESGTTIDLTSRRNRKTTKSAIPVLCRKLIAQGHDPQERAHVIRKSFDSDAMIPVFKRDRTLEAWASVDCIESDKQSLHFVKYRALPDSLKAKDEQTGAGVGHPTGNEEHASTGNLESSSEAAE